MCFQGFATKYCIPTILSSFTNVSVITARSALTEPDIIPPSISGEFTPENQGSPMTFTLELVDDQLVENDEVLLIDISSPNPSLDGLVIFSIVIVDTDSKYGFCKFVSGWYPLDLL